MCLRTIRSFHSRDRVVIVYIQYETVHLSLIQGILQPKLTELIIRHSLILKFSWLVRNTIT